MPPLLIFAPGIFFLNLSELCSEGLVEQGGKWVSLGKRCGT